ncbi:GntR family transcriptional regulator [Actinophytocola sp.]|uniref:GntR family transcriptional regulator n=1 Tax=Actinophytocola sp. TaxID=1872138 RepID=UPI003D6A1C9A
MTAPRIVVDPDSGVAPWRQVRDQLLHLVRVGALPVGSRLPAIRQLAGDLGLAAGTVARVYRELEAAGVLRTARRAGTVVAAVPGEPATDPCADPRADALARLAADYAARAAALGADARSAADAVLAAWPLDVRYQAPVTERSWHDH